MEFSCKKAISEEESAACRNIVLSEYVRSGYLPESALSGSGTVALPSDELVSSATGTTVAAYRDGGIVGTISIVMDSPNGLPIDSLYRDVIDAFRKKNLRLAEVTRFAIARKGTSGHADLMERLPLLASLFKEVLRIGKENGVDAFCIMVNPKHGQFYENIGFVSIGPERSYAALKGALSQPKMLSWKDLAENIEKNPLMKTLLEDTNK